MNDKLDIIAEISNTNRKPAGKYAVKFILNSISGAIPFGGGIISGGLSLYEDIHQQKLNDLLVSWASKTEAELNSISDSLKELFNTPTKVKFALLVGEIMGDELANIFLSAANNQVAIVLNNTTLDELSPYIDKDWITVKPTGAVCSLGAFNRVGNHYEELKRPYGIGTGFLLNITESFFESI